MKQILIILMIFNGCFVFGQQLLTPYNGTLSATAQQILQQYQADATLNFIGIYEVNGKVLYDSSINVTFGSYNFQFYLDNKGEVAMRKLWQGSSILGDKITIIHRGSIGSMSIQDFSLQKIQVYNLEKNIHGIFEVNPVSFSSFDCSNENIDFVPDEEPIEKSPDSELHCPLRIGMSIADKAFDATPSGFLDDVVQKIVQSNDAYRASQTGNLFDGISVELAYLRHFPLYSEFDSDGITKKKNKILREFSEGHLNDNLTSSKFTRNYYDADFCGIIFLSNKLDDEKRTGGVALGISASYNWAYFAIERNRMRAQESLTFTHELGHLFACIHDYNNDDWWQISNYRGYYSVSEEWTTIMAGPQRVDNNDENSPILTNRVGFHSNPFLSSSIILLQPPGSDLIPTNIVGNFPNNINGVDMGTIDDEFCMNGIAKKYKKEINLEVTTENRYHTVIRTDGAIIPIPIPFPNTLSDTRYADIFIPYADLLTYNDITFSEISRITSDYERLIRAGNSIDINSNSDPAFEFDAQNGSVVDIRIVDFANSPSDCEPNFWEKDKSAFDFNTKTEKNKNQNQFSVLPNPTRSNPTIKYQIKEDDCIINLWIVDALGRTAYIVYQDKLVSKGNYTEELNINNLPSGYYKVVMTQNGQKLLQDLIIIK
jgi:hypothetical protein